MVEINNLTYRRKFISARVLAVINRLKTAGGAKGKLNGLYMSMRTLKVEKVNTGRGPRRRINFRLCLLLSLLCVATLLCAIRLPRAEAAFGVNGQPVLRVAELTLANYDSSDEKSAVFNSASLAAFYKALTGGKENATLRDVKNLVTGNAVDYGYAVKNKIAKYYTSKDFYGLNGSKNIVVEFGGQEWYASFLTTDLNGNVIVTLWLTEPLKKDGAAITTSYGWGIEEHEFPASYLSGYLSCAYSTSLIRVKTLNGGDEEGGDAYYAWSDAGGDKFVSALTGRVSATERKNNALAKFTLGNAALAGTDNANKSLIGYITRPCDVEYTYCLDYPYASGADVAAAKSYLLNDALTRNESGDPVNKLSTNYSDGAHAGYWKNGFLREYANGADNRYNDWAKDYVWLPTLAETGSFGDNIGSGTGSASGLWDTGSGGLSNQVKFGDAVSGYSAPEVLPADTVGADYVYLRGGGCESAADNFFLTQNGRGFRAFGGARLGVRPALHLNLTAADDASFTKLAVPSGVVETEYNGDVAGQSLNTLTSNLPLWYNAEMYKNSGIISVSYAKAGATGKLRVTDAGAYVATVTINSNAYVWADNAANPKKERVFTFKIKKKELEVEFETADGLPAAKLKDPTQVYSRDMSGGQPKFTLATKYSKDGAPSGATYASPDDAGCWYAHAFISECNYTVSGAGYPFTITKTALKYPTVANPDGLSYEYTGTQRRIDINGYDPASMSCTPPTGATLAFDDATGVLTVGVKNAGEYTIEFGLKNGVLHEWEEESPIKATITPKAVQIEPDGGNKTSFERIEAVKELTFNVPTALCVGDTSLKLVAVCLRNGVAQAPAPRVVCASGGTYKVTLPSYSRGSYSLTVGVADGENYVGSSQTFEFEIVGHGIDVGYNDIIWKINGESFSVADENDAAEIEYTGKPLTLVVDYGASEFAANLEITGAIGGDWTTAIDRGEYVATVRICSTNAELVFDREYSLKIRIIAKPLEYAWTEKETTIAGTTFAMPVIEFADGKDHSGLYEYYYVADGDGGREMTLEELETYVAEHSAGTAAVTGKAYVRDADDGDGFAIAAGYKAFTTGKPKTALAVRFTGVNGEYGKVDFDFSASANGADERGKTSVAVTGDKLEGEKVFDGDEAELKEFISGLGAGSYTVKVSVKEESDGEYALTGETQTTLKIAKRKLPLPTMKKVVYTGEEIYFKDCIAGFDGNSMEILTGDGYAVCGREWREEGYTSGIALKDGDNYEFEGEETSVRVYVWKVNKYLITNAMWEKGGKDGASLRLPEFATAMLADGERLSLAYMYYADEDGEAIEDVNFVGGKTYFVKAVLSGSAAANFEFENGTTKNGVATSAKTSYTVPQAASDDESNPAVIIGVLAALLLLLALIIFSIKRRRAGYYDDSDYDYYYDYDDEDEDEYEDDDEDYYDNYYYD